MENEIISPKYNFGGIEWYLSTITKEEKNMTMEVAIHRRYTYPADFVYVTGLFSVINQHDLKENYYQSDTNF